MGFDINNFLNAESKKEVKSDWKPVKLSVHKLRPAAGKENFYHMDDKEIEETARTIELVGIQQYPVVKPIPGTDEYEIIAGHKRRLAILKLIAEGKTEYEMIPCKIETAEDSIKNRLILIFTNSTQRERTDYEKMQEIKEVRQLLEEWQKDNKIPGKMQNVIADFLGTNKTKIGTLEHIDSKLIEPFKAEFAAGKISTNAANEIAGLDEAAQQVLYDTYKETGSLTAKEVKTVKEPEKPQEQTTEQPKEAETKETPKEPEKAGNEAQDEPQQHITTEPETKITYNAPAPDNTDRTSLIINGKINMNKEYNGMRIMYFMVPNALGAIKSFSISSPTNAIFLHGTSSRFLMIRNGRSFGFLNSMTSQLIGDQNLIGHFVQSEGFYLSSLDFWCSIDQKSDASFLCVQFKE